MLCAVICLSGDPRDQGTFLLGNPLNTTTTNNNNNKGRLVTCFMVDWRKVLFNTFCGAPRVVLDSSC